MSRTRQNGKLVILSGPSGVGKSTICRELMKRLNAVYSVSATTRRPGAGEEDGRDYWFMNQDEFERKLQQDEFIEYADVFGQYYGTPRQPVEDALADGRIVILEIDVQGARQVIRQYPAAVSVFILPPRQDDLAQRIDKRNRGENNESRKRRLDTATNEIAAAFQYYKHQVVNDDLDQAIVEVVNIIEQEQQPEA